MQSIFVVQNLLAAPTRAAKERIILDAYATNCFEFFEARRIADDPFIHFGLDRVAEILEDDGDIGTFSFVDFRALCDRLSSGRLSEEATREAIHKAAERCHAPTWNLIYRRVLLKDFKAAPMSIVDPVLKRLGVSAARYRTPVFQCQTAVAGLSKMPTGARLVDVKLTGMRVLTLLDGTVSVRTGDGKLIDDNRKLAHDLRALAVRLPTSMVLDGVLTGMGDYYVFDLIPLGDFHDRLCAKPQSERRVTLERLQASGGFSDARQVKVLPQIEIDFATDEGRLAVAEFSERALDDGYTALVIKKPDAHYVGKRSSAWAVKKIEARRNNA